MEDKNDFYSVLGISKDASDDEIKKAYRKMAKKYHPDANPGDKTAEEQFKKISEAYDVLSDSQKRATYDRFGKSAFENGGAGAGGYGYTDVNDIFESFFGGGFGDIFGGGRGKSGPKRGMDVQTNLNIPFEESYFGTKKKVSLNMQEKCDTCDGTGAKPGTNPENCRNCGGTGQERVEQQTLFGTMASVRPCKVCRGEGKIIKSPCQTCNGRGKVKKAKTFELDIPAGIASGQSLRLAGKGEPGERGGYNGDLLVTIIVSDHDVFVRKGSNIHLEMPISFTQASLGAELSIPTINGEEKYTIKEGTQTGTAFILKGKGFPSIQNNRIFGDMIVTLKVMVPKKLNEKQRDLLRQFAEESNEEFEESKKSIFKKIKRKFE